MLDGLRQQFDQQALNSSSATLQRDDDSVSLTSAVLYDDKRAHFVFSDRTAMILHPNGDCFTLFARNGSKIRQLVKYATNSAAKETSSGALSKLILALQFFNSYASEPILARDEQLEAENCFTKLYKYTSASWPGLDNLSDYLSHTEDGNFTIRSSDEEDLATVTLSASGFQVMCTFMCLLPYKKPQWIEVNDMDKSMMSAKVSDGGRSNYNSMTSRRMKMAYEYTRITQVFTLSAVPPCWIYPVSLLLQAYCE